MSVRYTMLEVFRAQIEKGNERRYGCAAIIGVFFLSYLQEGLGRAFRSDFGITKLMP